MGSSVSGRQAIRSASSWTRSLVLRLRRQLQALEAELTTRQRRIAVTRQTLGKPLRLGGS